MRKSKFFELLSTFNKKQKQELSKLINQNEDEGLIVLFNYLSKQISIKVDDSLISREYVLKNLYKNKIEEKKLQKLLNDGVKLCEWIIIKQNIENDQFAQQLILAEYYQKHKLDKYFNQQIQTTKEEINLNKETSYHYFYLYRLEHLSIEQELITNLRRIDYSNLSNYLNEFYEIEQLKIKCVTNISLNNDLRSLPPKSLLYKQYYNCYTLLMSDTEEEYMKFWGELLLVANKIEKKDLGLIANIYYSFCINQLNKNNTAFYMHLLNAYTFGLDNNTLFEENGLLLPSHFKNIVTISLRLNKLDYAYEFVNQYKSYLPTENKEDVYSYNLAHIYFYQQKYDDVLTLLVKTKFTDVFYKLSSRVLLIKTYAELSFLNHKYNDVLDSSLNAFKKYIYTNKEINESYEVSYKNFYKIINKILNSTNDDFELNVENIKTTKPLPESDWLYLFLKKWNSRK